MKHVKILPFLWGIIPILIILLLGTGSADAASMWSGKHWMVISSPGPGSSNNYLTGVATLSQNDVWAVGGYASGALFEKTLIEHWNGSKWKVIFSPNIGTNGDSLHGIAAVSASNIWAVGEYGTKDSSGKVVGRTLIEHWNGNTWRIIFSPNTGASHNELNALSVVSATNIWAVGEYLNTNTGTYQTLIEHWNGSHWRIIPSLNPGTNNHFLHSVAAATAHDIWAVGEYSTGNRPSQALIEHWNGISWKAVVSPTIGTGGNYLNGVTALSANDAWAVGNGSGFASLIEHWDGKQWKAVPLPILGVGVNIFQSVTAISAHNIWAVGYYFDRNNVIKTLIANWNGTKWRIVSSPNTGSRENLLNGLAGTRDDKVWAVGFSINNGNGSGRPLIEFYGA